MSAGSKTSSSPRAGEREETASAQEREEINEEKTTTFAERGVVKAMKDVAGRIGCSEADAKKIVHLINSENHIRLPLPVYNKGTSADDLRYRIAG